MANYLLTFQQYLQNPSGPYSAYFGRRSDIKEDLTNRFHKLLKKHGDFKYKVFHHKEFYYYHIIIPSEKYDGLNYDVVFKMSPQVKNNDDRTVLDYKVEFFSNSPAFVFTYAYVFNKDKILVLKEKINKEAIKNEPKVKNPVQIYGFEKSLYFALLFIKHKNYHVKLNINSISSPIDIKKFRDSIRHSDETMKAYNRKKNEEAKEKREQKKKDNKNKKKTNLEKQKTIIQNNKNRKLGKLEKLKKNVFNKIIKPKKKL